MMMDKYEKIIAVYSLSKRYSMTGWRIGYIVANEKFVETAVKIHDSASICACTIAQYGAIAALENDSKIVPEIVSNYKKRRDVIMGRLDNLSDYFEYVKPAGGYYIFPKIKFPHDNSESVAEGMIKECGVITVPGSAFGPIGESHLRLVFCISEDLINRAFDRIDEFCRRV